MKTLSKANNLIENAVMWQLYPKMFSLSFPIFNFIVGHFDCMNLAGGTQMKDDTLP